MKQATTGNKDIIKKLLTDSLSPEEREKLNNYKFVNQAIYSQWEQASDMYTDVDKEERMLTNVMHQIKKGKTGRFRQSLHRYGWVASIALLLICGTLSLMLLSRKAEPEVWYVLNSGRQSMDSVRLADGTLVNSWLLQAYRDRLTQHLNPQGTPSFRPHVFGGSRLS